MMSSSTSHQSNPACSTASGSRAGEESSSTCNTDPNLFSIPGTPTSPSLPSPSISGTANTHFQFRTDSQLTQMQTTPTPFPDLTTLTYQPQRRVRQPSNLEKCFISPARRMKYAMLSCCCRKPTEAIDKASKIDISEIVVNLSSSMYSPPSPCGIATSQPCRNSTAVDQGHTTQTVPFCDLLLEELNKAEFDQYLDGSEVDTSSLEDY